MAKPMKVDTKLENTPVNVNTIIYAGKSAYDVAKEAGFDGTVDEWLESLKKPGKDGKSAYEISKDYGFTGTEEEWVESLKFKLDLTNVIDELKRKNIYIPGKSLEQVLGAIISNIPTKTYTPLTWNEPHKGDTEIRLAGEPHFSVRLQGTFDAAKIIDGYAILKIPMYGEDNIFIEYINLLGEVVETAKIEGIPAIKTKIKNGEFAYNYDVTTIDYPEVTTVGSRAFEYSRINTINLPKATNIAQDAFDGLGSLSVLSIPSYIMPKGKPFNFIGSYDMDHIVINDKSDIEAVATTVNTMNRGTLYNQDKSKKFNKNTKVWDKA
ncbi:MAG: leucine-rich repeat protein [Veillonella sp.]|uniref:leucine-rich repeat protein n=1 Tax=Veillonella sp. TaxID=1926307 RepID=UPI00205BED98|nr:leucine-rich repeat protein [Veillonella sp.]MDU6269543.1 leucine-rich repeat protein [Veillonella sp.]MDU6275062.1 leucine-rich repeat protein [Veillonella sp.]DAN35786.1 MAG TPA: tail sheath protein [Caudoviricetes sp.]